MQPTDMDQFSLVSLSVEGEDHFVLRIELTGSTLTVEGHLGKIADQLDSAAAIKKLEISALTTDVCNMFLKIGSNLHITELHLTSVDLRPVKPALFHSMIFALASLEKLIVSSWTACRDHINSDFLRHCAFAGIMHLEFPRSAPCDNHAYNVSDGGIVDFAFAPRHQEKYRHLKLFYGHVSPNFFHMFVERSRQSSLKSGVFLNLYPVVITDQDGLEAYDDCKEEWANATVFKFRPRPPYSQMYLKVFFNHYDDSLHVYRVKDERFQPTDE